MEKRLAIQDYTYKPSILEQLNLNIEFKAISLEPI